MAGMEKISGAILSKVRKDAQNIIREAEERAREEIEKAEKRREERTEEGKHKMIEEAEGEAARILARASIKARQGLLTAKASIIDEVINRVKNAVSGTPSDKPPLLNLIKEAIGALGANKARIYVSPKDVATAQGILKSDKKLASKVVEIMEFDCMGGVVAEDIDAKVRIDNTYETRLEILLPKILPEVSKELFEGL